MLWGDSDKMIGFVDEQGVALAAIQALNQRLNGNDSEIQQLKQNLAQLAAFLAQAVKTKSR